MKATIVINEIELAQLVRERILRIPGVDKITQIVFPLEYNRAEEMSIFQGASVSVELKEKP